MFDSFNNFLDEVAEPTSSTSTKEIETTTQISSTIQTTTEYITETTEPPKPPNIENLNVMLDPSKKDERKKKVLPRRC